MLDALKRLISRQAPANEWKALADWAKQQKLDFKRVHDGEGFVIDGGMDSKPWRLEWGPPQRLYIRRHELRLRMELGLSQNLQMLLVSQPLLETLELETFERYTESMQTVIDTDMPEEMRWLAMYPKANYKASRNVRMRFGVVGNDAQEAASWVEGALAQQLEDASANLLDAEPPFVLMTLRGRLYLRMQLVMPQVESVSQAVALFETAVLQAVRVAAGDPPDTAPGWSNSTSTAWQTHLGPDDPKGSGR